MALPPTIPTSFVPHTASTASHRSRTDLTGAFSFLAYTILGIVFVLAIGVFFYGRILAASQFSKDTALKEAESNINLEAVDGFIRLRDRLTSGETLLANHVAFSGFFTLLETILPTTVRFNTLHLSVEDGGTVKVEGTGIAKRYSYSMNIKVFLQS